MRALQTVFLFLMCMILINCARSPKADYYILNPLPMQKAHKSPYQGIKIGIDALMISAYLLKPEIIIHTETNALNLQEFHLWAETLDKSIPRIIATNLSVLLPGAVIETAPWDYKFKPQYQLGLNIIEFGVDVGGNSVLRAELLVYSLENIIKKQEVKYCLHTNALDMNQLVSSMNANLTHFSKDIAAILKRVI